MKKIDLPLWTDTLFAFAAAGAFFFCLLRFYIPSAWGAAAAAAGIGGAAALLVFRLLRARRRKKRGGEERRRAAEALAFHLAMRPPEETARLFARCLGGAGGRGGKTAESLPQGGAAAKSEADGNQTTAPAADTGSETAPTPAASAESKAAPTPAANAESKAAPAPAAAAKSQMTARPAANARSETTSSAAASAESGAGGGNEVRAGEARYFLLFRLEKVTADELRPAVVAAGRQKICPGRGVHGGGGEAGGGVRRGAVGRGEGVRPRAGGGGDARPPLCPAARAQTEARLPPAPRRLAGVRLFGRVFAPLFAVGDLPDLLPRLRRAAACRGGAGAAVREGGISEKAPAVRRNKRRGARRTAGAPFSRPRKAARGSPYRYSRAEKITGTKAVNCIKINKNQPEILLVTSANVLGSPSLPPSSWNARCQRLCQRQNE